MATAHDPARLSPTPFTAAQRQRLEACTAAKMLLRPSGIGSDRVDVEDLLRVADFIATGDH